MAKGIIRQASKDDPIFNGGFVISSFPGQRVLQPNKDEQPKRDKDPDARAEKTRPQVNKKIKHSNKVELIALPKTSSRELRLKALVEGLKKQGWQLKEEQNNVSAAGWPNSRKG